MLEYEKKCMLSREEYERLIASDNEYPIYTQVNYYYDTKDLSLNRRGITYRIRKKKDNFVATKKHHGVKVSDRSIETAVKVANQHDLSAFADEAVILQGELKTERKDIPLSYGIVVSLDKNTYLGTVDYELEIEYAPYVEKHCDWILRTLAVTLGDSDVEKAVWDFYQRFEESRTKSERFFLRKEQLQGDDDRAVDTG